MASMNRHRIAICVFIYLKARGLLRHRQSKEPTERTDGYITIIWNRINFNAHFAVATPLFFVLIVLPSSSVEFRFSNFALLWRKHQLLLFILNRAWHFYLRILLNTSIFILLKIRLHESLCSVKLSLCRETKRKSNSSTWNSNIRSSYINDLQIPCEAYEVFSSLLARILAYRINSCRWASSSSTVRWFSIWVDSNWLRSDARDSVRLSLSVTTTV